MLSPAPKAVYAGGSPAALYLGATLIWTAGGSRGRAAALSSGAASLTVERRLAAIAAGGGGAAGSLAVARLLSATAAAVSSAAAALRVGVPFAAQVAAASEASAALTVDRRLAAAAAAAAGAAGSLTVGGGAYACTLTAGSFVFSTGYVAGAAGSIDQQPVPGETLRQFVSSFGTTSIKFEGDVTGLLAGLTVYVGGVSYAAGFSGWSYNGGDGTTGGTWSSGGPVFVSAGVYAVEIK